MTQPDTEGTESTPYVEPAETEQVGSESENDATPTEADTNQAE